MVGRRDRRWPVPSHRTTSSKTARPSGISHSAIRPDRMFEPFGPEETDQTIGARIAMPVQRMKARVANHTFDGDLTYAQIDATSNRVARAVCRATGEGTPKRIALLQGWTESTVSGLLCVLKSGTPMLHLSRPPRGTALQHAVRGCCRQVKWVRS
jgi:hypothetical protein